jgi:hypothetical protein
MSVNSIRMCVRCTLLNETHGIHVKLLRWDLLVYIRYEIVRFLAVCRFIPSVCVSGAPYWMILCHGIHVKLLRWDLLIYIRYKIVRFLAVCRFIPSVCVSGAPYWMKLCHGIHVKLLRWDLLIYIRYKIVQFVAVCRFIPSVRVSGAPYWMKLCHGFHDIVSFSKVHLTHVRTELTDIWSQTTRFYNVCTSTDPILVT